MIELDPVSLEIVWARLIAVCDEAAAAMRRIAFSTLVRESNDFAVILMDRNGNSLVQPTLTIPSFIGTLPLTVRTLLKTHPHEVWRPGDAIITNDPWLGTGHLNDVSIVTPVFKDGELIAFVGNASHMPDIGGALWGAGCRELYEEGIHLPPVKLYSAGDPVQPVFDIIAANVRVPDQVLGDIESQITANETVSRRLCDLMGEVGIDDLGAIARVIQDTSEQAMRAAIAEVPDGIYRYDDLMADGLYEPINIRICVEIRGSEIFVDYAGTSPQQPYGVNSVMNYTYSYTAYPLKCVLNPEIPNNEGCFRPIKVTAPLGSILNSVPPAACGARNMTGHVLQAAVFGAMSQVVPDRVQAHSGTPVYVTVLAGERDDGRRFTNVFFNNGGRGGQSDTDGISAAAFPGNTANTPIEVIENLAPVFFHQKELAADSAGLGKHRGGLGQRVSYTIEGTKPVVLSLFLEKLVYPALGLLGGEPGQLGQVWVEPHRDVKVKGHTVLQPGDRVTIQTPGGGGMGAWRLRPPELVERDLREGYVTTWPN